MAEKTYEERRRAMNERVMQAFRQMPFQLNLHKATKLRRSCGKRLATRTLLDDKVHKQHTHLLVQRFRKAWGHLERSEAYGRLRFFTLLHDVRKLDENEIIQSVEDMEEKLRKCLRPFISQIGIIGVPEVEIVNLSLYQQANDEKEARKYQTMLALFNQTPPKKRSRKDYRQKFYTGHEHWAFIHLHAVVDFGPDLELPHERTIDRLEQVEKVLRKVWGVPYAVELAGLHKNKAVEKNFSFLADYVTKGGNATLRYTKRFGRDTVEAMELAMVKQGKSKDPDDFDEDHLGLNQNEIKVLVNVYDRLMRRNTKKDGYLFLGGRILRNRYRSLDYRIWKSAIRTTTTPLRTLY
jgi:hypothetical protein